jgi:hypothetical protein
VATGVATDSHGRSTGATQTTPDSTSVATGALAGHGELTNETGIVEPDPLTLTLTLYSDATHDRDIMEDPMLEEFAASLVGSWFVVRPSLECRSSPAAPSP